VGGFATGIRRTDNVYHSITKPLFPAPEHTGA